MTQLTRYAYDALGRRVRKTDAFGSTAYLWDGDLMIHSARGERQALFLYEPHSFVPLATVQDDRTYWYQCDQIGAPLELTDELGQIVWAADYKVWGEARLRTVARTGTDGGPATRSAVALSRVDSRTPPPPAAPIEQPFRFQGQHFDEETGLHYNRFRYYDPGVGRLVSQDPIGLAGGANLFSYAENSTGWIDPVGLSPGGVGRKQPAKKPNQDSKCKCRREWEVNRYDRTCQGHVPGVGQVSYYRDPFSGLWWSKGQTGHGGSAWKAHDKGGNWVANADI